MTSFAAGAEVVRDRCYGRCELCGRPGVQTHHRQPRGMGGVHGDGRVVNDPSALVRLCLWCHGRAESYRDDARDLGLLVPRPGDPADVPLWLRTVNGTGWYLLLPDGCYQWADNPPPADRLLARFNLL